MSAPKIVFRAFLCIAVLASSVCAALAVDRTTPVTVSGTPSVTIANTPTVSISATNNVVQAAAKSNVIQLWTTDQVLANNGYCTSGQIDCTGYREARVVLMSNSSSASLTVSLAFGTSFNGANYKSLGYANFATPSVAITNQGNFQPWASSSFCYFSHPILSNSCAIWVSNTSGASATISKNSWIYLIN